MLHTSNLLLVGTVGSRLEPHLPTNHTLCSTLDATFRPKPVIVHQHRQPERRAPGIVSLFFSLVALAPLAAYVVVALRIGANLKVTACCC